MTYNDVMMSVMASQITSLTIVYSVVYSGTNKNTSKLRLTGFYEGKLFNFDDVIMLGRRVLAFV